MLGVVLGRQLCQYWYYAMLCAVDDVSCGMCAARTTAFFFFWMCTHARLCTCLCVRLCVCACVCLCMYYCCAGPGCCSAHLSSSIFSVVECRYAAAITLSLTVLILTVLILTVLILGNITLLVVMAVCSCMAQSLYRRFAVQKPPFSSCQPWLISTFECMLQFSGAGGMRLFTLGL